jgi:hypothetical protein
MTAAIILSVVDVLALFGIGWFFKWIVEKWYAALRGDREDMKRFTDRAIEAMNRVATGCATCHDDMVTTLKDLTGKGDDRIISAVRDMGVAANTATGNIILALGQKERGIVGAVEDLLISLRSDLATVRLVPPAGGVGSQVRDSGGAAP